MNINLLAIELEKTQSIQHAEALLDVYLNQFGFKHYAFTYYSGHVKSGQRLRYDHVSKPLSLWHEYYLSQSYADVDRTLEENYLAILPTFWDVQTQLKNAKNKRELRIRLESIEFGIDKGLSLPIHGPHHDFANLALHQCINQTCLQDYELHQYEWLSTAKIYYHHVKRILDLNKSSRSPFKLTKREEQCLLLTAKSWRVEQIAKDTPIPYKEPVKESTIARVRRKI